MLKILVVDLANVVASGLLSLNGSYPDIFFPGLIYCSIALLCFMSGIYVIFFLKDVIKSDEFDNRRETISRESGKPNNKIHYFWFIFKQAVFLVCKEPYILIGIVFGTC